MSMTVVLCSNKRGLTPKLTVFPSMRWNLSPGAQVIVKVYSQEGAAS